MLSPLRGSARYGTLTQGFRPSSLRESRRFASSAKAEAYRAVTYPSYAAPAGWLGADTGIGRDQARWPTFGRGKTLEEPE